MSLRVSVRDTEMVIPEMMSAVMTAKMAATLKEGEKEEGNER